MSSCVGVSHTTQRSAFAFEIKDIIITALITMQKSVCVCGNALSRDLGLLVLAQGPGGRDRRCVWDDVFYIRFYRHHHHRGGRSARHSLDVRDTAAATRARRATRRPARVCVVYWYSIQ